jgi:glycosyltransferase involved in cell wall biosynthesis
MIARGPFPLPDTMPVTTAPAPTLSPDLFDPTPSAFKLSVIVPVYNERHVVEASLRRLLAIRSEFLTELEVIAVDDRSSDGSGEVLARVAADDPRVTVVTHAQNQGKGAAIRSGLAKSTGDIVIIHDADLEYDPADIPAILEPFAREGADAVFGSRYMSGAYRRALMFRHTLVNKFLTVSSNWLTDLALTDVETCYKAVNAELFKSIPLRSNDFRFEMEVVFKLAKRRARIFETPIRYVPRSHNEGKKIRPWDGVLALFAMLHFWIIDDLYHDDEYGSRILVELERTKNFNAWMANTLRPYLGDRVLEIGAGIGNLTSQFIPRDLYLASDINPHYLRYLRAYSYGKPYLHVRKIDVQDDADFVGLEGKFDTAVALNVVEHVPDPERAVANLFRALAPGGKAVILVPQHPGLYGTLDEGLGHFLRYTPDGLRALMTKAGFQMQEVFDFNRVSAGPWWFNGRVLKRRTFSPIQLKIFDAMLPIFRRVDRAWPWTGISVIGVGVKPRT